MVFSLSCYNSNGNVEVSIRLTAIDPVKSLPKPIRTMLIRMEMIVENTDKKTQRENVMKMPNTRHEEKVP